MQCISIQIQPEFSQGFDKAAFLARVRPIRSPEVDSLNEGGKTYLNFHFFTEQPAQLWAQLSKCLYQDTEYGVLLGPISIAACEGEAKDEFWLLHHFDPNEKLDSLS
jgi:hypothetical protein